MFRIDFSHPMHVHFIGIGGISMSGLAEMLRIKGFRVTGSDRAPSPITEQLAAHGIRLAFPQCAENIAALGADDPIGLVVYTAAVHADNPEYAAAEQAGLPMMPRAELLGQLMAQYPDSVAIAGTHGKTTTTAMVSHILWAPGKEPTVSIGAVDPQIGSNFHIGSGSAFVAEACEYTNSFLHLHPRIGVILNIEADHLDFFRDLEEIRSSFRRFAQQILPGGALVIGADIPRLDEIAHDLPCGRVVTFGLGEDADVRATDIRRVPDAAGGMRTAFRVLFRDGSAPLSVELSIPGEHNVKNALAAIACARCLSAAPAQILESLAGFKGARRRFETLGVVRGVTLVDDYAHHPTEIRATLRAARELGYARVWCAFQPHTYSRTKALFDDLAAALADYDHVVLADIYAARETDTLGVSSLQLAEKIRNFGTPCDYFPSFSELEKFLSENCADGDLLIFMGAGDIDKIGYSLLDRT